MSTHPLEEILHPRSIAVIGASGNNNVPGYQFTASLLEYGYKGEVYPVNPKYSEIVGLKAYPDIRDIPGPVDYVISCVPASQVLNMVKGCVQKKVKALHLFTARFSETGRKDAAELEQEILQEARKGGVRIIGPNCMGLYYPDEGISFSDAMPKKSGTVGLISQSGQLAEEFGRYAAMRGVSLSKAISYGNALDFNECDFLDYFSQDGETRVILMYVEGVRDGKRFFTSLREAASTKPVVILKGGKGRSGTRAAASHTASMAGSQKILTKMISQAGAVSAEHFEELVDLAAAFNFLPPISGFNVGVAGGGGGSSVLAADQCEASGLDVIPLPKEIREELKSKGSTIWDWIGNPADMSIRDSRDFGPGDILELMAGNEKFDILMAIMSDPHHERQKGTTAQSYLKGFKLEGLNNKPVLAVVADKALGVEDYDHWSWKVMCDLRTKLIAENIPFYPSVKRAATAARKLVEYYQRKR
ncbi:MAG: CoA-binding protein [Deltaproteobacteria bacterium]|nr:CoA-binding protein [Deltaproteobacteria bacterium]MBW2053542.1 CoA-binding protein [Deltaproteobacteria bacterium]MBW2142096.1 CoA-binding protein [Deltaproteobacteria bacterium]